MGDVGLQLDFERELGLEHVGFDDFFGDLFDGVDGGRGAVQGQVHRAELALASCRAQLEIFYGDFRGGDAGRRVEEGGERQRGGGRGRGRVGLAFLRDLGVLELGFRVDAGDLGAREELRDLVLLVVRGRQVLVLLLGEPLVERGREQGARRVVGFVVLPLVVVGGAVEGRRGGVRGGRRSCVDRVVLGGVVLLAVGRMVVGRFVLFPGRLRRVQFAVVVVAVFRIF